ncbi:MAG: hypothetical protein KAX49_06935 [Halanaerobiales bacterium]|nr:hypothetical protein [Halanaerobiales bacterium]
MAKQQKRRGIKWILPTRISSRQKKRYCRICGSTAEQVRILKHENICELCVKDLQKRKGGNLACKSCGKVVPEQVKKYNGYCKECVCSLCGKPDPKFTRKHGLCRECFGKLGTNCRICGKEAVAQVKKNNGICDACAEKIKNKQKGR